MRRIEPYFPLSHGVPRVDDRLILSGTIFVLRNGLRWRDAPREYDPHKTIYNRSIRWSRLGVFSWILAELIAKRGRPEQLMIDAAHLKAHRTAASLLKKGDVPRRIGRTKGGLNSKLHAVCDRHGRPLILLLSEGQMSDYKGAAKMLPAFPKAKTLLADKGYDADWFRDALAARRIKACIPSGKIERPPSHMMRRSIKSATNSKTCLGGSRTGAKSTQDMTAARAPSSQAFASLQPSSFGYDLMSSDGEQG